MNSPYSLGNEVIQTSVFDGGRGKGVQQLLKSTVGANLMITAAVIIVLVIIIIYLVWKSREGLTSPTGMMRYVQQSLSGSDALEMPSAAQCAASAANPAKGAWGYMNDIAHSGGVSIDPYALDAQAKAVEGMSASNPALSTDNALTAVMKGY